MTTTQQSSPGTSANSLGLPAILVLGVICTEKRRAWRERLRAHYADHTRSGRVIVRYVLDEDFFRQGRGNAIAPDELAVPTHRGRDRHCAREPSPPN